MRPADAQLSALLTAGFVLFLITLVINTLAAVDRQPKPLGRGDGGLMTTYCGTPVHGQRPADGRDGPAPVRRRRGPLARYRGATSASAHQRREATTGSDSRARGGCAGPRLAGHAAAAAAGAGVPLVPHRWFVLGRLLVTAVTDGDDAATPVEVKDRLDQCDRDARRRAARRGSRWSAPSSSSSFGAGEPLLHLNFYIDDMAGVGPQDPFDRGGVMHAIVGSLIQIGIALAITLPLGIGTAVFMTEVGGRFARSCAPSSRR